MDVDFSGIGRLLSSPARSAMLAMLFEGEPVGATVLARGANVAPSTASEHLGALVEGGMARVVPKGRHRYYQIASPEVAEALEALGRVCPRRQVRSLRASQDAASLGFARTCYDHLAGSAGVAVLDALLAQRWIVGVGSLFELGPSGRRFAELGIDAPALRRQRRSFAKACVDTTERRPHLSGSLGAALCRSALDREWFVRRAHGRGLKLTGIGAIEIPRVLGVDLSGAA
jgi:DNA-binding transcriptional ArsR family regulator